jgi:hypothetical protein
LKRSRGELGLVKGNRPENGSTSDAREKRGRRRSVRPKQIVRRIAKQLHLQSRPLHRNIRVERTHASHRKARMWAAFHTFDRPFGRVKTRYGEMAIRKISSTRDDPRTVEFLSETFKPKNDGELYVYLNKPVSGFWAGLFSDVERQVRVVRIRNR